MKPYIHSHAGAFEAIRAQSLQLRTRHTKRKRSPWKFVEAFNEMEEDIKDFQRRGCSEFQEKIALFQVFLDSLRPDYELCLGPAAQQRERSEMWHAMNRPVRQPLEGGRADGN